MNILKFAFILVLTTLFQVTAQAQDWTSYQSERVLDLVDTGNELLMATDAGLVVMNKTTFEKTMFNSNNTDLSNNHIQSITEAPNGNIWIGTYDGVLRQFDGTGFQNTETPQVAPYDVGNTKIYDFKIAQNGDLWLATTDGVYRKNASNWLHYGPSDFGGTFPDVWDLEIDDAGDVFAVSSHVHKFSGGAWTTPTENLGLSGYLNAALFLSSTGELYMSGDEDVVVHFDGQQWNEYTIDFNGASITEFTEDANGNVYFSAMSEGIYKIENAQCVQVVDPETQAFDNEINYLHIDDQGRRWLNHKIHLSVNDNGNIQTASISEHSIESNSIEAVHVGANDKKYFITDSKEESIAILDASGNWSSLAKPLIIEFAFFYDILALADNDIWLGTSRGLYHYNGSGWTQQTTSSCNALALDSQGIIYARGPGKIIKIENNVFTEFNTLNSPLPSLISAHGVDANDNLWIGAGTWDDNNVILKRSANGTWTTYSVNDHPAIGYPRGDIHFDAAGNLWVPTDLGAIKFDGTEFTNPYVGNETEMANSAVQSIESDANGKMYFSHQYGLTTLLDGEWEDLLIETLPQEAISAAQTKIDFDEDGTLCWGSKKYGVFTYTTETVIAVRPVKEELVADFSVYPNPAHDYTTLNFSTEKETNVQVFIYNNLGQLMAQINLGEYTKGSFQETINVANLAKGFYTLQVELNGEVSAKTMIIQ